MSYRDVMDMPLRSFWTFNKQVDRIRAEQDLRAIDVGGAMQSSDTYKAVTEKLRLERGKTVEVIDNRRDSNATAELMSALADG